jgi:shikimate 5-dehydrogenase
MTDPRAFPLDAFPALDRPTLVFLGVTTGGSSIQRLFPRWAEILGLDAQLVGLDLPVDAPAAACDRAVATLAADPMVRGALVTTHKIAVWRHAAGRFAGFDPWAEALGEVGCIVRAADGRLTGLAMDAVTAGRALDRLVPAGHWQRFPAAEALILGAGGAGVALAAHLLGRDADDRPVALRLADVDPARLEGAEAHLDPRDPDDAVAYHPITGVEATTLHLTGLPPGSLVVNATGLGKDRPGSPIADGAPLPFDGIAWELNYRGELTFLDQARAQAADKRLTVGDGWLYFLYGWSTVIAEVFGLDLDAAAQAALEAAAEPFRPVPPP